jgi:hypothetical protein
MHNPELGSKIEEQVRLCFFTAKFSTNIESERLRAWGEVAAWASSLCSLYHVQRDLLTLFLAALAASRPASMYSFNGTPSFSPQMRQALAGHCIIDL